MPLKTTLLVAWASLYLLLALSYEWLLRTFKFPSHSKIESIDEADSEIWVVDDKLKVKVCYFTGPFRISWIHFEDLVIECEGADRSYALVYHRDGKREVMQITMVDLLPFKQIEAFEYIPRLEEYLAENPNEVPDYQYLLAVLDRVKLCVNVYELT